MINYAPFCGKQNEYLRRCPDNWLNVAEGGKRAGKNVINIMAWCEALEMHKDKLHLAAGVSIASAKLNIIDSNGYGVRNWFEGRCRAGKYQLRDALYISTLTGEKVILISGGGKEGDERYIKGNTYGSVYITEVNECSKTFVKETFDRTLSSTDRKMFFDLNPKSPQHWFYTEILDMHQANNVKYKNYGLNYEHFTLHDNFSFTAAKIKEIIRTYTKNTVWYIRDILGRRTNAEGIIYDSFGPGNRYKSGNGPNYDLYYTRYYSIDYGTTNPFALLEIIEQANPLTGLKEYFVESEYYYDSKKHNRQKDDSEYVEDVEKFMLDKDGVVKRYTAIVIDPSAASFKVALRKRSLRPKMADDVINARNEVVQGIRLVSSLLRAKRLKVNQDKCPNLLVEFASYIWNDKASERGVEEPVKANDHGCDALRYHIFTIVKRV
ncbi:MAG TPA: PBSX family phage terminase large subunit [Desulfosporosinus sp.]|nr:PBSX family phage terminase large subunit [Desulfosporosinus sp.]